MRICFNPISSLDFAQARLLVGHWRQLLALPAEIPCVFCGAAGGRAANLGYRLSPVACAGGWSRGGGSFRRPAESAQGDLEQVPNLARGGKVRFQRSDLAGRPRTPWGAHPPDGSAPTADRECAPLYFTHSRLTPAQRAAYSAPTSNTDSHLITTPAGDTVELSRDAARFLDHGTEGGLRTVVAAPNRPHGAPLAYNLFRAARPKTSGCVTWRAASGLSRAVLELAMWLLDLLIAALVAFGEWCEGTSPERVEEGER